MSKRLPLPEPTTLATLIGVGRIALGSTFLVAPVFSTKVLGVDTASAKRMTFLARMTAARDIAIGAGTTARAGERDGALWVAGGALCDAADAVAIAAALKTGTTRGPGGIGMVGAAAASAVIGLWTARRMRQH